MNLKLKLYIFTLLCMNQCMQAQDYTHSTEGITTVKIMSLNSVIIKAYEESDLLIPESENERINELDQGFKPVFGKDNTGYNVFIQLKDESLVVESFQSSKAKPLILYLPATIKVYAGNTINNDITMSGFKNEIVATAYSGDIILENIQGPVIAENLKGNINIVFNALNQSSPMSIINSHGDIDLTIPSDENATIEVSVPRGELYTDLVLETVQKSAEPNARIRPDRNIISQLNKGGVSINIVASKGNVFLRKL